MINSLENCAHYTLKVYSPLNSLNIVNNNKHVGSVIGTTLHFSSSLLRSFSRIIRTCCLTNEGSKFFRFYSPYEENKSKHLYETSVFEEREREREREYYERLWKYRLKSLWIPDIHESVNMKYDIARR